VGMLTGILSDAFWRKSYGRLVRRHEEQGGEPGGSEPEFRLPSTMFGAFLVPVALFGKLSRTLDSQQGTNQDCMQGLGGPRIPQ